MAKNKKLSFEFDIKTVIDTKQIQKFKDTLNSIKISDKKVFSGVDKELGNFLKQLESISDYQVTTGNFDVFQKKVLSLKETYKDLETEIKAVENTQTSANGKTISQLQEIITKTNERLKTETKLLEKNKIKSDQLTTKEATKGLTAKQTADLQKTNDLIVKREARLKSLNKTLRESQKDMKTIGGTSSSLVLDIAKVNQVFNTLGGSLDHVDTSLEATRQEFDQIKMDSLNDQIQMQVKRWTSLAVVTRIASKQIREMTSTYRSLDQSLTAIAVVSGRSRDEMWAMIGTYNEMAQRLGVTTKDVVESSKLYFQQGRSQSEVMKLVEQTTILASIANLDFADATNYMTAAINGFKLSAQDAIEVTDTWANLSSQAAVSTEELATAISKVASIAQSAGMDINSTSAFLTKMIETTREAPENLGTALKTVIARFQELKESTDDIGEGVDVNKVEKTLKKADVALRDTSGQFRDFDDVILELSSKWDGLDRNTQRYIATIAAGSRQQSRFIALVQDYERNLELMDIANNSAGASTAQFATQLTGLEASFNRLTSAWEGLYTSFNEAPSLFSSLIDGLATIVSTLADAGVGMTTLSALVGFFTFKMIATGVATAFASDEFKSFKNNTIGATAVQAPLQIALGGTTLKLTGLAGSSLLAGKNLILLAGKTLALSAPFLAVGLAVAGATAALIYFSTKQERDIKKTQEQIKTHEEANAKLVQETRSLQGLSKEYERAFENGEDLTEIKQKMIDSFPQLKAILEDEASTHGDIASAIEEEIRQKTILAGIEGVKQAQSEKKLFDQQKTSTRKEIQKLENQSRINAEYGIYSPDIEKEIQTLRDKQRELDETSYEMGRSVAESISKGFVSSWDFDEKYTNAITTIVKQLDPSTLLDENDEYNEKQAEIIKKQAESLKEIIDSVANTPLEDSLGKLLEGKIKEISQLDLSKLEDLFKSVQLQDIFAPLREEWETSARDINQSFSSQLGEGWDDLGSKLSYALKQQILTALRDAEPDAKANAKAFYETIFSDELENVLGTSQIGESINLLPALQQLDITNMDDVYNMLVQIGAESEQNAEIFKNLSSILDLTQVSFDGIGLSISSFYNDLEILKEAVSDSGTSFKNVQDIIMESNGVLDASNFYFDALTNSYKLNSNAAEKYLAIKKEEAIQQAQNNIETHNAIIALKEKEATDLNVILTAIRAAESADIESESFYDLSVAAIEAAVALGEMSEAEGIAAKASLTRTGENRKALQELKQSTSDRLAQVEKEKDSSFVQIELLKEQINSLNGASNAQLLFGNSTGKTTSALEKQQSALKAQIDELKYQQELLKRQMQPTEKQIELIEREIAAREYQIELISRQKRELQKLIDAIQKEKDALQENLDKEKDIENKRIDAAQRRLEVMMALIDAGIDASDPQYANASIKELEDLAKSAERAKEWQEKLMAVEKARDAYEDAKKQKTQAVFYADKGWVWEANQADVLKKKEDLDNALADLEDTRKDIEKQKLQDLIDAYEDMRDQIGMTLEEKQQMEQFDKEFAEKTYDDMLADLEDYVTNRVPHYQEMNQQIKDYDDEIKNLTDDVDVLEDQIKDLEYANTLLKDQINDLKQTLVPLQNAYKDLGYQIDILQNQYDDLAKAIDAAAEAQKRLNAAQGNANLGGGDSAKNVEYTVKATGEKIVSSYNSVAEAIEAENKYKNHWGFSNVRRFAEGGINDYTGPAALHGTKSRPELVLNNSQSAALFKFISGLSTLSPQRLNDLSGVQNNSTTNTDNSTVFSNCTFELDTDANSVDDLIKDLKNKSPIRKW